MQLVAYGAQDIYLTGNPQITFFKVVYRRYTNFSMEAIEQTFNGTADFGKRVTCTISRNGDLIGRVYLQVTLPLVECPQNGGNAEGCDVGENACPNYCFRWVNYIGHALISNVQVEIGGQRIDQQYGDWLNIWNELTQEPGHQIGYDNMVGNTYALTGTALASAEATTLYVPFQFWFCRNPGLALPLIALQYHEVKINLEFRSKAECYVSTNNVGNCGIALGESGSSNFFCVPSLEAASLYVDYVYLDTDERRRFAQVSHEYLIEQLQFTGDESITSQNVKVKLNFNHPVKELIWVVQRDSVVQPGMNQWTNYTDNFDNDTFGCVGPNGLLNPTAAILTNIESGYSAVSFPNQIVQAIQNAAAKAACGDGELARQGLAYQTTPQVGNTFLPPGPGTGVNNNSPVNFSDYNEAAGGADHAGLAPRRAGRNPVVRAKLQLNGHDRFSERLGSYFNLVQPYQHHTNVPAVGINVYSFALKPEEHQPSGTCNFSRIDNATLQLQVTPLCSISSKIRVYATNYNVLRIMSGMGGLAYSN
jgi:hypothetical protein